MRTLSSREDDGSRTKLEGLKATANETGVTYTFAMINLVGLDLVADQMSNVARSNYRKGTKPGMKTDNDVK
ncbi:hypothetical protein TNCV_354911 [Trichonephila clavipes]|uniref:Uncharacterized protein n=1 Tax=Trichonephila clavipes TaxID=2585209 RepID=A0A8X7BBT0_TRICX|nr:hypothetical protein TNCV_354911 [Trichonephila clavipes]